MEGNDLLTAREINIPALINNICNRAIMPKTSKSTLERVEFLAQFLVRQRYSAMERNSAVKKNPSIIVNLETLLFCEDLK